MDNPILYSQVNSLQAKDTQDFLEEYLELVQWKENGGDQILDIGCGTGNVTAEILIPMLPRNYKQILATDINEKMITNAAGNYFDPKLKFDVLDIGKNAPEELIGKFDHVFSFFCLHWLQDQSKLMQNIFSLLKPGGDTLFIMVCKCAQVYESYAKMSTEPRWRDYMFDLKSIILPYQDEKEPQNVLRKNLENAGFTVNMCERKNKKFHYPNEKSLSDFMESINPFIKRMPDNEKREFMDCFIREVKNRDPDNENDSHQTTKHYTLLMAHAIKM